MAAMEARIAQLEAELKGRTTEAAPAAVASSTSTGNTSGSKSQSGGTSYRVCRASHCDGAVGE